MNDYLKPIKFNEWIKHPDHNDQKRTLWIITLGAIPCKVPVPYSHISLVWPVCFNDLALQNDGFG